MSSNKRRQFSDTLKADTVRRHLDEKVPVSNLADELGVQLGQRQRVVAVSAYRQ